METEPEIELRYVAYVVSTGCAFGPFSSKDHAELWAMDGAKGLEFYVLQYVNLLEKGAGK